jgi:hypothetical protein
MFERQWGIVRVEGFTNGSPSAFLSVRGRWNKPKSGSDADAAFVGNDRFLKKDKKYPPEELAKAFIDSSDLSFSYSFPNRSGTKTFVELGIRRSTGRFTESFSWQDARRGKQKIEVAGRCFHYKEGVLVSAQ